MTPWANPQTLRSLRLEILRRAMDWRSKYRTDRMGFQRRMMGHMLRYAADYRRQERAQ